jgi:hypothetical protein
MAMLTKQSCRVPDTEVLLLLQFYFLAMAATNDVACFKDVNPSVKPLKLEA